MITATDAVLCLSNSGETPELNDLVAHAKRFDIPLIAIIGRPGSSLGQAADIALVLPGTPEACPLGLAPTTSTTMMLALGDALAVALLERKGFTAEDFQVLHPGGKLGKALIKVSDIMHVGDEVPLVRLGTGMRDAVLTMTAKTFGCVGIADGDGKLVGIITDGDLRRHIDGDLFAHSVDDVMTRAPKAIRPQALAAEALGRMKASKVTALFVVADGRPIGIVRDPRHAARRRRLMPPDNIQRARRPLAHAAVAHAAEPRLLDTFFERAVPRRYSAFYSHLVTLLKLVLPSVAVGLVAMILLWPQLNPIDQRFRLKPVAVGIDDLENLRMINPRYTGSDTQNQPYVVTADQALQVSGDSNVTDLVKPKGDLTLKDGTWLALSAEAGVYRKKDELLDLEGNVNLFHDGGYEIATSRARIDLRQEQCRRQRAGRRPGAGHGAAAARASASTTAASASSSTGQSRLVIRSPEAVKKWTRLRAFAGFARVAAILLCASAAAPAHAQAVNLGGGGSEPIEIIARDGIEWNREAQQYIARGDARASQAGTTVEANVLTAYYRERRQFAAPRSTATRRTATCGSIRRPTARSASARSSTSTRASS